MSEVSLQFIPIMIVGFAASLGATPLSRQIAMRLGVVDKPNQRKIHMDHKPLMGGLAIYLAILISLLLFSPPQHILQLIAILAGTTLLAIVGGLDDRYNLGIRTRLIAMFIATLLMLVAGIQIKLFNLPLLDSALTVFWVLAIINACNFLDNMDGLTAGLSTIAAGFFLLISLSQGQELVSLLAAAVFGSALGFLTYNFNPASTFMGDMGALVLGYVLAILAIKLNFQNTPVTISWFIPVLVLALPIFDINLVVWTRIFEGRTPGEAGKDHTSHRIMSLGLSQRQTLLVLYAACIFFGSLALGASLSPPDTAILIELSGLVLLMIAFIFMIWVRQNFQKRPQSVT
ncbi:MraY family glycosyltransferase [Anaerolineales bacterium]